ncbi:MAG: hydratase [Clostridia bacterium]|nr:hydratase [Clostridia bacterium]
MIGIKLTDSPVRLEKGCLVPGDGDRNKTIAAGILSAHNTSGNDSALKIRFDGMASHDITFVGIIQTARASGMERFPMPYVLTCCHNSLCAVGGTINADDHAFGLSAAKKYGGIFVPPHAAVIHQFMREKMAGCGKMLLGSDSHTRYGALGSLGVGEGGPELAKQLVGMTYDIDAPGIVAVRLTGSPRPGVGPQDVAIALVGAVFANGFVKNKILEFSGPGIASLPMDFRLGIDVMTTETTCLSSVWETDETVREWLAIHGRENEYSRLTVPEGAGYCSAVEIDLSAIEPMIALPFHPSNAYTISEFLSAPGDLLRQAELKGEELGVKCRLTDKVRDGRVYVDQGIIAGCAGGLYDNICAAADIIGSAPAAGANGFALNVYPASMPVYSQLMKNGAAVSLLSSGAVMKTAFCGPCFGAGDVPSNGGLSIRHSTRNFPSREGAKPGEGQSAAVALMDARSIAATAAAGGVLTAACSEVTPRPYFFDGSAYAARVCDRAGNPEKGAELVFGPNITDWPVLPELPENIVLKFASVIFDPVTTTDELIPSGETSSFRSNPLRLAEFALSRKDPAYVGRAKAVAAMNAAEVLGEYGISDDGCGLASAVFARKPGDGSAREQAASCQRVLGGGANVAVEYATKRYRSNLINWGMLPLRLTDPADAADFAVGRCVYIRGIREAVINGAREIPALLLGENGFRREITLTVDGITDEEKDIILAGSLIGYYRKRLKGAN